MCNGKKQIGKKRAELPCRERIESSWILILVPYKNTPPLLPYFNHKRKNNLASGQKRPHPIFKIKTPTGGWLNRYISTIFSL
jgi:hypothetical protein